MVERTAPQQGIFRAPSDRRPRVVIVIPFSVLAPADREHGAQLQMVLQVAPTLPAPGGPGMPQAERNSPGPHAGALQDFHRTDGTGAEIPSRLAARLTEASILPIAESTAARRPSKISVSARTPGFSILQIAAVPHRIEESLRAADQRRPRLLVDVEIAGAFIVAGVEIVQPGNAHFPGRVGNAIQHIPPHAAARKPALARGAMMLAVAAEIRWSSRRRRPAGHRPSPSPPGRVGANDRNPAPGRASRSSH